MSPTSNHRRVTRRKEGARAQKELGEQGKKGEEMGGVVAECLRCKRKFAPRKAGHVFCSRECRHRGPRKESDDTVAPTEGELARLFDPKRDPESRVEPDDWHPTSWDPEWVELDLRHTVSTRRRWFRTLVDEGRM